MPQAGTAWVAVHGDTRQVEPEVRRAFSRLGPYAVEITPQVKDLAAVRRALAAIPSIQVPVDVDDRQLAELRAKLQTLGNHTVGVDISAGQVRAELAEISARLDRLSGQTARIQVAVDAGAAAASLQTAEREVSRLDGRTAQVQIIADAARFVAAAGVVMSIVNQLDGQTVTINMVADTGRAIAGMAMVAAKAGAIGGAVGGVAALGSVVMALGPAGAVAAGGLGAAVLASGGVGKALTALSAAQDAAGTDAQASAKKQSDAARQVQSAQERVSQAVANVASVRQNVADAAARANAQVQRAEAGVAQATEQARDRVAQAVQRGARAIASAERQQEAAQRTLRRATADLAREQDALTDAWEQGRRSLQDLQDQVDGNALDQRQAAFDLADARRDLAEAQASGDQDAIARAQLALDRQVETMDQLNKQTLRLTADNAQAQRAGVAGSEQVVAANERVASARERVGDAERAAGEAAAAVDQARIDSANEVARAREEGDRAIAAARQQLLDAEMAAQQQERQGREQIADANRQVIDAQRALQDALAATASEASSTQQALKTAFDNLSPAAAQFALYLWSLKGLFDQLRATAASGFFPPVQAGIQAVVGQFSVIQTVIGQFASAVGGALGYILTTLANPWWTGFFSLLGNVAGPLLMQLAQSFMAVAGVVAQLIVAMLPFAPMAIDMLTLVAALIDVWTPFLAILVGQLLPVAGMVIQALMPLGPVLAALAPILAVLGQAFSMVLAAVLQALAPILVALTPLIQQLALAFADQLVAAITALTPFLVRLATFMSQHPQLVLGVITVLGALFSSWQLITAVVGMLLGPLTLIRLAMLGLGISAGGLVGSLGTAGAAVAGFFSRILGGVGITGLLRSALSLLGQVITYVLRAVIAAIGPLGWIAIILGVLYTQNEAFRGAVGQLVGVLMNLVGILLSSLAPVLDVVMQVMTLLGQVFAGVAAGLATALVPVIQALADLLAWLTPVIVPLVQVFLAVRAAMTLWAAAQWALNIAMAANPIGLIVVAVAALVGAAVWAYQNLSWFRDAVDAVGQVFVWLWQNVLQPVVDFLWSILGPAIQWIGDNWSWLSTVLGILVGPIGWVVLAFTTFRDQTMAVLSAVGGALLWLWQTVFVPAWNAIAAVVSWAWTNIVQPVLSAIWTGLQFLGAIIFTVLVAPFVIAWNLISAAVSFAWTNILLPVWNAIVWFAQNVLGPAITWLYVNIIKPIWDAIGAAISFVWNYIILPVWNALVWYIDNVTIPVMQFLYYNVIKPIWDAIGAAISFVWNYIILPVWNAIVWTINTILIPAVNFLYYNVIKPVWDAIGAAISFVWTNVIQPAFNAVWGGLQWLGDRFQEATDRIGQIWNMIRGFLARPINFMIDVVWNRGIVPVWNKVAGLVGIGPIQPLGLIPEFATGGPINAAAGGMLSGPGTGTSDSILARVSTDEFVVRAAVAQRVAPFLAALNSGDGEALQAAGGTRAGKANQGRYSGRSAIGLNVPGYAMGGPIEERIGAAKAWLSGPARGIPYVYGGGTTLSGTDCSGMVAMVTHILSGRSPYSGRIGATASMPWGGFVPGINGQWAVGNKPSDHMAGTLAGQNVEQHGPSGTPFRFPSRWGADNGYFPQKYHLAEAGGSFVSGGAGSGGGWFNPLPGLVRAAFLPTDLLLKGFESLVGAPPPEWKRVPVGLAYKIRDTLRDWAISKAEMAGPSDSMDVAGIGGPVQDQVRQVAQRFGWDQGPEWDAIVRIVQKESSWNPNAASPISSARGLFQKMTSIHGPVEPTPAGQAAWGLNYIRQRYKTPTAAWAHHQARNFYDDGGWALGKGVMFKDVIAPERVLDPVESQAGYRPLVKLSAQLAQGQVPIASAETAAARAAALTADRSSGEVQIRDLNVYDVDGTFIGRMRAEARTAAAGELRSAATLLTDGRQL